MGPWPLHPMVADPMKSVQYSIQYTSTIYCSRNYADHTSYDTSYYTSYYTSYWQGEQWNANRQIGELINDPSGKFWLSENYNIRLHVNVKTLFHLFSHYCRAIIYRFRQHNFRVPLWNWTNFNIQKPSGIWTLIATMQNYWTKQFYVVKIINF